MSRIISNGVKPSPEYVKLPNVEVTANSTADSNKAYWVDTNGGAVNLTLPPNPVMGDIVRIFDVRNTFDSNNLTIVRNGNPIMGTTDNMTVNTEGAAFELVFYNTTYGWRVFTI